MAEGGAHSQAEVKIKTGADVEPAGHTYRSHRRPGPGAGSRSGTRELEPVWDRRAEPSQLCWANVRAALDLDT